MGYSNQTPNFGLPQYAMGDVPTMDDYNRSFQVIDEHLGKGTGGAVESVFGRAGKVMAQTGDYTADMVGAIPNTASAVDTANLKDKSVTTAKIADGAVTIEKISEDVKEQFGGGMKEFAGAGYHNSVYRGKYLGEAATDEQYAAIAAGTFDGLYIGDYWTRDRFNWRIAAFDYYYGAGDIPCTTHHVTVVPDTTLYDGAMNDTNITTGAYVGSKMYTEGLTQAKTTINTAFGEAHILNHRQYLQNAVTNGYASGGSWYDSTVELMTEQNVYGGKVFGNCQNGTALPSNYTVDKSQYPLFAFRPDLISNRQWFWLRDVVTAAYFVDVYYTGGADYSPASTAAVGVRPAFSIIG